MSNSNISNNIIELKDIVFAYNEGVTVLNHVSFSILNNEYVCIIGQNGSGKSTISKILMGLLKPISGEVIVNNILMSKQTIKSIRNIIGIVFQNPDNQFIGMTAEDDIAFGLENRCYEPDKIKSIIMDVAKKMNITNLLAMEPASLSGGQKQKVAIAGVLAFDPKIIIFDESTSMLDPKNKKELKRIFLDLKKMGKTIISITHDMEEVMNADKVIVLNKGHVVKNDKPSEIFQDQEFVKNMCLDLPTMIKLTSLLAKKHKEISISNDITTLIKEVKDIV